LAQRKGPHRDSKMTVSHRAEAHALLGGEVVEIFDCEISNRETVPSSSDGIHDKSIMTASRFKFMLVLSFTLGILLSAPRLCEKVLGNLHTSHTSSASDPVQLHVASGEADAYRETTNLWSQNQTSTENGEGGTQVVGNGNRVTYKIFPRSGAQVPEHLDPMYGHLQEFAALGKATDLFFIEKGQVLNKDNVQWLVAINISQGPCDIETLQQYLWLATDLHELDVSACRKLKSLPEYGWSRLKNLEKLSVRGLDIENIPDNVWEHLPNLEDIDVAYCKKLTDIPATAIQRSKAGGLKIHAEGSLYGDRLGRELWDAAEAGDSDKAIKLIQASATVDYINEDQKYSRTPLHEATRHGYLAVAKALIKARANLEAKDTYGATPLNGPAFSGDLAMVKVLVEARANLEASQNDGRLPRAYETPLDAAAYNGSPDIVKVLVEARANLEGKNKDGSMPLILAADANFQSLDRVKVLVEARANIEAKNSDGRTPLIVAADTGHLDVVQALIKARANIDAKNSDGSTSLIYAASHGHLDIVKVLLEAGAEINAENDDGETALTMAEMDCDHATCRDVADYLRSPFSEIRAVLDQIFRRGHTAEGGTRFTKRSYGIP